MILMFIREESQELGVIAILLKLVELAKQSAIIQQNVRLKSGEIFVNRGIMFRASPQKFFLLIMLLLLTKAFYISIQRTSV